MDNNYISKLAEKRNNWVQSTKDNNFENGINNLLTELYPENAHFIYELLQNAEDAQASKVLFELSNNQLTFKHNGRPFLEKDIDGITSIGQGTKANDINKIGKFGVGFKAVFSYTDAPEIHSDKFHFKIQDLVIPVPITPVKLVDDETIMVFPFSKSKDQSKLFNEIKSWFQSLSDNTLLFLDNISQIEFSIDGKIKSINRTTNNDIEIFINNKNTKSNWLRFKKYLPGSDKLFVSVAYKLELDDKTNKKKIVPIKKGEVSIFFPAEKETSNLKFHLHAPFASTVARDSIKNLDENKELLELIAQLIGESLIYFKENDLLSLDFLGCLPLIDDNLSDFYLPIKNHINEIFKTNELLLTEDEKFVCAKNAYRSNQKIKKVIDVGFLKLLKDIAPIEDIFWIKNPNQNNGRADKFLKELDIEYIDDKTFIELIEEFISLYNFYYDNYNLEEILNILNAKSNKWFINFYTLLFDLYQNDTFNKNLNVFVKLNDDSFNIKCEQCYFIDSDSDNSKYKYVNPEVYENIDDSKSINFLKQIGVKNLEIEDEVNRILNKFYSGNLEREITIQLHKKHWILFINYIKEKKATIDVFNNYYVFVNNEGPSLCQPSQIIKNGFFFQNNLEFLIGYNDLYTLNEEWYEEFINDNIFKEILNHLNFSDKPIITEAKFSWRETHPDFDSLGDSKYSFRNSGYYLDQDFYIENQDFFLKDIKLEKSIFLWNCLQEIDNDKFYARFKRNSRTEEIIKPSTLIYQLNLNKWIPNKFGEFFYPKDISELDISDKLILSRKNDLLKRIELGKNIVLKSEEIRIASNVFGLSKETTSELMDIPEEELKEMIKLRNEKKIKQKNNFIEDLVSNDKEIDANTIKINPDIIKEPSAFEKNALSEILEKEDNIGNEKTRHSTYKVKIGEKEAKEFLYKQYKGFCQICGYTFSQSDNKNYFELFNLYKSSETIEKGASLCCCSRCHSNIKYGDFEALFVKQIKRFRNYDFNDFIKLFDEKIKCETVPSSYKFIEMDMYKLNIRKLNSAKTIYFTEEHFIHFFTLLKKEGSNF
jgi:hypothetical protein